MKMISLDMKTSIPGLLKVTDFSYQSNSKKLNFDLQAIQKLFSLIFVFFCLIPYASFGTNDLDSQPWPLLLGILTIFILKKVFCPKLIFLAISLLVIGLFWSLFITNSINFFSLRATYNYTSFFIVLIIFYTILRLHIPPIKLIKATNYLWFLGVIIEAFAQT